MSTHIMSFSIGTVFLLTVAFAIASDDDPASNQLVKFKERVKAPIGVLSTSTGEPVDYATANSTLNKRLLYHPFFFEQITHLDHEKIPERVVHGKGAGAFGYFKVTHDISHICKAALFSKIGKETPVAVRFSLVGTETGGSDVNREVRGFAVKFYTEEGNFDLVGLNMPMFVLQDPLFFPAFAHTQKRNPATFLKDANMLWDFITSRPESLAGLIRTVFSVHGIPDGYRHMPGFGIHTFQVENQRGDIHFVRFHLQPDAGIRNILSKDAKRIQAEDLDYFTRDLYNAIAEGNYPSWSLGVQILSTADVENAKFNVFDPSKLLPVSIYPVHPVGKLVLKRNAKNYFAEIEKLAFCPSNLVPGIPGSPDKLFEARIMSYRDAQNYRLGINFNKIEVNRPLEKSLNYYRDGVAPVNENHCDGPNYYPNSFNGPQPCWLTNKVDLVDIHQEEGENYEQIREIYCNEFTADERTILIENIVDSLKKATKFLQDRAVKLFSKINSDLGVSVRMGLQANKTCD